MRGVGVGVGVGEGETLGCGPGGATEGLGRVSMTAELLEAVGEGELVLSFEQANIGKMKLTDSAIFRVRNPVMGISNFDRIPRKAAREEPRPALPCLFTVQKIAKGVTDLQKLQRFEKSQNDTNGQGEIVDLSPWYP